MTMKNKSWFKVVAVSSQTLSINIYGVIGDYGLTAQDFEDELNLHPAATHIKIRFHSEGGSVIEGYAIYNILKRRFGTNIETVVDGVAASMASYLFMLGERRVMPANTWLMIHGPRGGHYGQPEDLRSHADLMENIRSEMAATYGSRAALTDEELESLMTGGDTWINAETALEMGFATEIEEAEVQVAAQLDFSSLSNVPKEVLTLSAKVEKTNGNNQETAMPKPTEATVDTVEDKKIDVNAVQAEALQKNQTRVEAINAAFEGFADHQQLAMKCILDQGCTVEQAQAKLLAALGQGREPVGGEPVSIEDTGAKASVQAMADVLALRSGQKASKDVGENPYRGSSLLDMARASLEKRGFSTAGMDKMGIVGAAFTHSSSDFPYLLENTLGKVLQNAYTTFPETWREIADIGQVSDFKQNSRIRLGSFNSLDTVLENDEYQAGSFGEERETIQAATKGKMISLSRQAIINDDLNAFVRLAQMLGRAAQRTIGNDVYSILTTNGAMSDGVALFHADHKNLAGSGAAMSVATVGAGRAAMRKQTDADGNDYLNINPSRLVVPVALEDAANVLMASETDPSGSNSKKPNPLRNAMQVVSDPRLDANSATAWYLLADSMLAPTIEVAFLDGNETPYLESSEGFTVDGVRWKVRLDYGVAAVDFRGAYKNAGA